ncbi:MAG TPA: DUF1801 domain-containing protein [Longimicrobiales bacterium]
MPKAPKVSTSRKPPEPADSHAPIDELIRRVMPDLNPIVVRIDELIRSIIPDAQYAVKWKKAYYGLPKRGWVIELVSYDVSVNVVFLAGGDFDSPPPLGEGRGRYVKVKSLDDVETPEMRAWIEQAARVDGWKA